MKVIYRMEGQFRALETSITLNSPLIDLQCTLCSTTFIASHFKIQANGPLCRRILNHPIKMCHRKVKIVFGNLGRILCITLEVARDAKYLYFYLLEVILHVAIVGIAELEWI